MWMKHCVEFLLLSILVNGTCSHEFREKCHFYPKTCTICKIGSVYLADLQFSPIYYFFMPIQYDRALDFGQLNLTRRFQPV